MAANDQDAAAQVASNAAEQEAIASAIQKLSPAEAEFFLHKLERSIAKRRVQLWGYLLALVAWAVGMFFALALYGAADPNSFRAWYFLLPFAAIAAVLYAAGLLAERVAKAPPKKAFRAPAPGGADDRDQANGATAADDVDAAEDAGLSEEERAKKAAARRKTRARHGRR